MTTLVEDITNFMLDVFNLKSEHHRRAFAADLLARINQHPETLERRRRDFHAWKAYTTFNDYLAAEKGEK